MPHERNRYIESPLKNVLALSPLVGILGHRQVGKTTLLEKLSKRFHTLDSAKELSEASSDPETYVSSRANHLVAIDECQLAPALFPALKDWVRKHKKPGQFILSGSVRFTSREAIKESLTGRIMNLELLPLSCSEILGKELSSYCPDIMKSEDLSQFLKQSRYVKGDITKTHEAMKKYFSHGGLPGICFIRDDKLRSEKISEQLLTILDRDLRMVQKILVPYSEIRHLLTQLARTQGLPIDYSELKKNTGLATPTIKKIINALEAVFILRQVAIEGTSRNTSLFFEDQGEHSVLSDGSENIEQQLLHFAYTNIRTQFEYKLGIHTRCFQYRTRGGAFIPLCFENKSGVLGILPIEEVAKAERCKGSINSFLSAYKNAKVIIVHPENVPAKTIGAKAIVAPMGAVV